MIVEMIARDVGERTGSDPQPIEPILIEAMGRRFDRQMGDTITSKLIDRLMQHDGVRRREGAVSFAARRYHTDRADAGGAMSERGPDLPRKSSDRSLAAGPSDGRDNLRLARIKLGGDESKRPPRVTDPRESTARRQWRVRHPLGQNRHGAGSGP